MDSSYWSCKLTRTLKVRGNFKPVGEAADLMGEGGGGRHAHSRPVRASVARSGDHLVELQRPDVVAGQVVPTARNLDLRWPHCNGRERSREGKARQGKTGGQVGPPRLRR